MKINVLVENTTVNPKMKPQKGLSLFIELDGMKILFDMGCDGQFIENAKVMGVDIGDIDIAVISHGHNDHGGGLGYFLAANKKAPVYLHEKAFGNYVVSRQDEYYIGLDQNLKNHERIVPVKEDTEISDGIHLMTAGSDDGVLADQNKGLYERQGDSIHPDKFRHEINMVIETDEGYILVTGCAHRGITNILESISRKMKKEPDVVVGGFHLNKFSRTDLDRLGTAKTLKTYDSVYMTGHCTGTDQFNFLKESLGDRISYLSSGSSLSFSEKVNAGE